MKIPKDIKDFIGIRAAALTLEKAKTLVRRYQPDPYGPSDEQGRDMGCGFIAGYIAGYSRRKRSKAAAKKRSK